jgi:hypothetical protein
MITLASAVLAVTEDDAVDVGPIGFIAIAFVAVCVVLLIMDMTRRIRRARIRDEVAAKLDAEQAQASDATQ